MLLSLGHHQDGQRCACMELLVSATRGANYPLASAALSSSDEIPPCASLGTIRRLCWECVPSIHTAADALLRPVCRDVPCGTPPSLSSHARARRCPAWSFAHLRTPVVSRGRCDERAEGLCTCLPLAMWEDSSRQLWYSSLNYLGGFTCSHCGCSRLPRATGSICSSL